MRCLTSTEELEKITQTLTETIIEACNETIPQTKSFKKSNNWWNEDINVKRKLVNRLRRLYQRTTNEELRDSRREEYFSERKLYQSMIRKSKFESWKRFYFEANAWDLPFKMIRNKLKIENSIPNFLKDDGNYTKTLQGSLHYAINQMFKNDDIDSENELQKSIREDIKVYENNNND